MEKDILLEVVNNALDRLYENDFYLIKNNLSERNLVFHFSRYFIDICKEKKLKYANLNVDCEYNRNRFNEKMYKQVIYENQEHQSYPDCILHERGSNNNNILVIEFKKANNKKNKTDLLKLKAFTDNHGCYKYLLGLAIQFESSRRSEEHTSELQSQR